MSRFIAGFASLAIATSGLTGGIARAAEVEDATGQIVKADDPSRLLSIGADTTEILYALGLGDQVVAVDTTSQFPPEVASKRSVGYMRALSTEGVLSTGASLILANAHAGPPEVVRALKASSVPVVVLPGNEKPESLIDKVRLVGRTVGVEAKAEALAEKLNGQFRALEKKRSKINKPARALVVMSISGGRALVGGTDTTADIVLALAGAKNAAASLKGYKPVSDEALIDIAPDAVIAVRRQPGENLAAEIAQLPAFNALGAGKKVPIITMDATYLLGFGPRTPAAAEELMTHLYPGLPRS